MPYPESFIGPMREELTRLGVQELRTPAEVDAFVGQKSATVMVVVNSMCGCAAGKARPGIALALRHAVKPDAIGTVFAGGDIEATERARTYFTGYPPSSPSIAILRDGQLLYMMERRQIENQAAEAIARDLTGAFDRLCTAAAPPAPAR
jgi:putative YphP/YqiW family bacilliredoxin